jgi:DNA-binding CsgD family transcriptional regulator
MAPASLSVPLHGRRGETELLADLVAHLARGAGGAMVVRGEAGIGKSALLAQAAADAGAAGVRLLTAAGIESEAHLPFAGLHQLVAPVLSTVEVLPARQRGALLAAFGMGDGDAPGVFLIALAALNLVGEAAVDAPVLLLVEDAHWLDRESADVLAFVARRLDAEPVALLAALRDGFPGPLAGAGLPELRLQRLDRAAAVAVLDARAPRLSDAVRERLLLEAAGNPLALVELPARSHTPGGDVSLPSWLPLTRRLEQAFAARLSGLPVPTRALLLVTALDDGDGLAETLAAAAIVARAPVTEEDLAPAIAARLVDVGDTSLRFVHPLMRSAIRQGATVSQRHAVHAALANVLAGQPDRCVWHRAAASPGRDEAVAGALEAAALRAHRRGATVAAVKTLQRAARLSEDPVRRAERLLRAAELAFELGRHDMVDGLLRQATVLEVSRRQRERIGWIRQSFDEWLSSAGPGGGSLPGLAEQLTDEGDHDLALRLLRGAAIASYWTGPGLEASGAIVAAVERMPLDPGDPRRLGILAYTAPVERGATVIEHLRRWPADAGGDGEAGRLLATAAGAVGAFDLAVDFGAASVAVLRTQGRLGLLARALTSQGSAELFLVNLGAAGATAAEAGRLGRETSQPLLCTMAEAYQALIAALRGDRERADAYAAQVERDGLPVGVSSALAVAQAARGAAALGDGRYADAYGHLGRMHDPADPAYHAMFRCFVVGDLAEAAARSGQAEAVRAVMEDMERVARLTPSPALHVGLRHARTVLAAEADAEPLHRAALGADLRRWPYARARAQLGYGEWLRRRRRVAESRGHLRAARETFDALGTTPWSERARQELRASGETSRQWTPEARDRLTPQELQIAQMAAVGLTNREIGHKLYLSHRTIGAHLYRIYPKLGITSRSALGVALGPLGVQVPAPLAE